VQGIVGAGWFFVICDTHNATPLDSRFTVRAVTVLWPPSKKAQNKEIFLMTGNARFLMFAPKKPAGCR
jgi:hypothetical protein